MLNKLFPNAPNVLGLELMKRRFSPSFFSVCMWVSAPSSTFFSSLAENVSLKASVQESLVFFTSFFFFLFLEMPVMNEHDGVFRCQLARQRRAASQR